jgi:hypothetical protein
LRRLHDWEWELNMRIPAGWEQTVDRLDALFADSDVAVVQSFDLQTARAELRDPAACPCPYHGTDRCTCQYIVYLVYTDEPEPTSVIVHGHDNWTYVSVEDSAGGSTHALARRIGRLFGVDQCVEATARCCEPDPT